MAARPGDVTDAPPPNASAEQKRTDAKAGPPPGWLPHSFHRDADGTVCTDLSLRALAAAANDQDGVLWVDVDSTNRHQHAVLEKVFRFHPLAIEDTLSPNSRVKYEEYDGYLFVIARGVKFAQETADPYDVETLNLYFFLGRNFLVTVHGEGAEAVQAVLSRISGSPDMLARGPAKLMHAVLDSAIDAYFPILDCLDDFIDDLEERVFNRYDEKALRDIFSVKRLVLTLRRHLAPQREVLNQLTNRPSDLLPPAAQVYYRDVYDHVLRINDSLDTYRELLSSTLDSYLSQVSNRLSQSSKGLTVVATVTLPFVIMSGMWGMNFTHIPLGTREHGFALLMVLQC
ncbi:MAG: magnesium transporter CorA family protein, partial [Gemmatirosa sp.]|nr:magnesium transporter CorA family protein [Gemmatirosa sp.]